MKFTVANYEIEIKAKTAGDKRYSKEETMYFMNQLSIWMSESGYYTAFEHRNDDGFYDGDTEAVEIGKLCGERLKDASFDIHDQLDALGFYDDIR